MNIALLGYGKMGRAIAEIARQRGHTIALTVTSQAELRAADPGALALDVALEFSTPEAAFDNITFCLQHNIPVVSGTTGWLPRLPEIAALTKEVNGTFFYAANFSLGVNLFFQLNRQLAQRLARYDYRPEIEETHHIHKKDAPSGTAITLAEDIIRHIPRISEWVNRRTAATNQLPIISLREGEVPGTHKVKYNSGNDEITIIHRAKNRQGFALGAVLVAEWLPGKKGVLAMEDFMNS